MILNIPIEGEKALIPFYDRLKKMRVSFAELPDLKLGDGYTQIAYNPDDVESVRLVIDYYKKKLRETPKDIDIDEYMAMAGPDGRSHCRHHFRNGKRHLYKRLKKFPPVSAENFRFYAEFEEKALAFSFRL